VAVILPFILLSTILVFALLRAAKVDPVNVMLGQAVVTDDVRASLRQQFGLNQPLPLQYLNWLLLALRGDFGIDYVGKQSVTQLIEQRIPTTIGLVVGGLVVGVVGGIALGIVAALRRNTWIDRLISLVTLLLTAIPSFLLGVAFLSILVSAAPTVSFTGDYTSAVDYIQRMILPSLVLGFHLIGLIARVTRASMISQLDALYSTGLRASGIPWPRSVRHIFRNAFPPVLTIISILVGVLIGETVLVETIFSLPGLSGLLIDGVKAHNYPIVQAVALILVLIFCVFNLAAEYLNGVIDPRVRAHEKES
jgi:peptide/nickel transport system permease protein